MSVTPLHQFGWKLEEKLLPRLEDALGEKLRKTEARFDSSDYISETHYIELKCRRFPVLPNSYNTWLLPCCKAVETRGKELIFFYYFEADDSLWYLYYDKEIFDVYERHSPACHPTRQEHFYTDKNDWIKI